MIKAFSPILLISLIVFPGDAIASTKKPSLQQRQAAYTSCLKKAERQYKQDLRSGKMTAESAATVRLKAIAQCQFAANGNAASKR